jgi:hypothetical protein
VRKVLAIGLLAALSTVCVGLFLLKPKPGSLAWHKKEYLKARDAKAGPFLELRIAYAKIMGFCVGDGIRYEQGITARMRIHETALIEQGYLAELTFVVSNRSVADMEFLAQSRRAEIVPYKEICRFDRRLNSVVIVTQPKYAPQFTKLIREGDVSE